MYSKFVGKHKTILSDNILPPVLRDEQENGGLLDVLKIPITISIFQILNAMSSFLKLIDLTHTTPQCGKVQLEPKHVPRITETGGPK